MALIGKRTRPRQNRPLEEVVTERKARKPIARISKFRFRGIALYLLFAGSALGLLALANGFQENLVCKDISISIQGPENSRFLEMEDVKQIIGLDYEREIVGEKMSSIELIRLEEILRANLFVRHAEVYKSVKGVLYIDLEMREPIARVISKHGSTLYVDEDGYKFPVTRRHIPNIPLVRGHINEILAPADSLSCEMLETMPLLRYIHQDPFWKAQISEIRVKENGDHILYPEVGNIYMEFGDATRMKEKFANLDLFYKKVVNELGWKRYKGVSVKYRGQVVARRK